MPSWAAEVLKVLGFATPFVYAAATYGFFHWLDKKVSGQAKTVTSSWINSSYFDKRQTSELLVEVFDRIYTYPLWGWRAILRSVLFTTVATIFSIWTLYPAMFWSIPLFPKDIQVQILQLVLCNFVADYLALFLIRRWLIWGGDRPLVAAIMGPVIRLGLLWVVYTTGSVLRFSIETKTFHLFYFFQGGYEWMRFALDRDSISTNMAILLPALIVHVWLPLFVISVLLAQFANFFLRAKGWMQWFIKQGRHHPFDAVGYVAAECPCRC